jgi:hypothetical protein
MGLDANAVVTNDHGKAKFNIKLDYKLLELGASPVVAEDLVEEGTNRVGGGWLRKYVNAVVSGPSIQQVDPDSGLPVLVRSTAQGITIVSHPDFVTHGHTPGVGGTDHSAVPNSSFKGDFPAACLPSP